MSGSGLIKEYYLRKSFFNDPSIGFMLSLELPNTGLIALHLTVKAGIHIPIKNGRIINARNIKSRPPSTGP